MKEAAGHQHDEGVERRAGNTQWGEDIYNKDPDGKCTGDERENVRISERRGRRSVFHRGSAFSARRRLPGRSAAAIDLEAKELSSAMIDSPSVGELTIAIEAG